MRGRGGELLAALIAIAVITAVYLSLVNAYPDTFQSSGVTGHLLGIVGFLFMLMTETLYSLRKRNVRAARWGRTETWLKLHIFTGIVGPYMVLLHSAWRFQGLAGVVTLVMVVIVASGFIGRYIYTLIPRTVSGIELDRPELAARLEAAAQAMQAHYDEETSLVHSLPKELTALPEPSANPWALIVGRIFVAWRFHWRWWRGTRHLSGKQLKDLKRLLDERRELNYQMASTMLARRILALWHTIHVPIGIGLFTLAFIHVFVVVYYVTLAR